LTVRHLSEGALRRLHDDRFAGSNREREHLAQCVRCQHRAQGVAEDAAYASRLFATPADPGTAADGALGRLRQRVAAGGQATTRGLPAPRGTRRRWALGAVAVPVVVAGLVVSANAAGWLSIFSPTHVAPVTLTASSLNGLPDLSQYGRMETTNLEPQQVTGPAEAASSTGLHVLQPSSLPADVPSGVRWEVIGHGSAMFTLDAATAAAAAASAGHRAPVIPASLDGTSVTVDAGPAVLAVYGAAGHSSTDASGVPPTLLIAEGVRPTASTNGATLKQLEDFLIAQPGVSAQLAAEIRAIGDPASTLPIPVISGMSSQTISIHGVQGVVTGDSTGLGSAVIWEKDGVVYAVGGLLPESEVLDIARSLR
jgi:hypothetical protein